MTNIQGSVQACPPRHARGTHKPLSSAQSRAQECESPRCGSSEKTLRLVDGSQRRSVTAAASGGLAALRVLHRRVRSGKTRAPHARRRGEQDMAGAPSRPRISMISDVSSGVPTARPCTWIRSPTSARMATPLKGPSDSLHLPASRWKRDELSQVRAKTLNHPTSLAGRSFGSRASVAQRAL